MQAEGYSGEPEAPQSASVSSLLLAVASSGLLLAIG